MHEGIKTDKKVTRSLGDGSKRKIGLHVNLCHKSQIFISNNTGEINVNKNLGRWKKRPDLVEAETR